MLTRRTFGALALSGTATALLRQTPAVAASDKTLRIATTLADIPLTTGQANQGTEGVRFVSNALYDGLVRWDLSRSDVASRIVPALAESWNVDASDKRIWTFRLRQGVKFHDGSSFDADSVIWNLDKLLNKQSQQFDQLQAAQAAPNIASIAKYRKIDASTVEITTATPDAVQIYYMAQVFMSSPARWEELGRDWGKFAVKPSGTGPFILESFVPRERATMVRNATYWDKERVPASARLELRCMPDANTRVAALLSGQVDWIEAPTSDSVKRLKAERMQIVTNVYPHIWPYQLNMREGRPFADVRVRKAANLAVDRDGVTAFLNGFGMPAKGMVDAKHPWFGKPGFDIRYDLAEAQKLMKEAGYGPGKSCKIKVVISPAGSGQMQPQPMNEFIQENLREAYFDVQFETLDWEALRNRRRIGAAGAENKDTDGINQSWAYWDPNIGLLGPTYSGTAGQIGSYNWGEYRDAETDKLAVAARGEFDPDKQNALLAKLHERIVDHAMWLWVVHDLNPRAMAPDVKGFVQAQNWFQDLTKAYRA